MEKSKLMMIVIIVLLVALLGTVVGVSFYVLSLVKNNPVAADEQPDTTPTATTQLTQEQITKISLGDPITTNLTKGDDNLAHVAQIGVIVGYNNSVKKVSEEFGTTLNDSVLFVRSIALSCIRNSTFEELNAEGGDTALADRIRDKLQEEFNSTLIVDVRFNEWILQ